MPYRKRVTHCVVEKNRMSNSRNKVDGEFLKLPSAKDDAPTQDPTRPQSPFDQPASACGPPAGQRSPGSLHTLCNHTRARLFGRRKADLRSRTRAERCTETNMKPNSSHTHKSPRSFFDDLGQNNTTFDELPMKLGCCQRYRNYGCIMTEWPLVPV